MVKKVLGKVDAVKVTRNGMVLISCVSEEQKECALWLAELLKHEVNSCDFQSRAPVKGVISGVPSDIDNQYRRLKITGVIHARCLTSVENEKK
jgi:hypothetical protein